MQLFVVVKASLLTERPLEVTMLEKKRGVAFANSIDVLVGNPITKVERGYFHDYSSFSHCGVTVAFVEERNSHILVNQQGGDVCLVVSM